MKGNRRTNVTISLPAKSGAGLTITTTAPTYRNYGDAEDGFRLLQQHNQQTLKAGYIAPPITSNQTPPTQDASSQIAAALERLAQSNEAALLPKSEIIRFDGDAKNYQRFITGFVMMITSRNIPDAAKLTYLIQYCEGKAKRLIEDPVMMTPKDGFEKALQLLKTEFGKKHKISRAHIDVLTKRK